MRKIMVIQPDPSDPIGAVGDRLVEKGFVLQTVRPYLGEPVPRDLRADALIVLGGEMGVGDLATYPWLGDLKLLLRQAVDTELPTLAICLGAQLLAAAHNGRVHPGAAGLEMGAVNLRLRAPARHDALMARMPTSFQMIAFHHDEIVRLPPEAIWLVEGADYPHQAFRIGTAAWGLQFHPEASLETYQRWSQSAVVESEAARRVASAHDDVAVHATAIAVVADGLFDSFGMYVQAAVANR